MTEENTITFEDRGALDTFIAMAGLTDEEADELRGLVEKHGYGNEIPVDLEMVGE